jgi:Fe-S-cluster-containing dehydrogenase component
VSEKGHAHGDVRFGMAIDLDKCNGCGACSVACQAENNTSFRPDESVKVRSITWMDIFTLSNGKDYPESRHGYLPRPCMHCDSPHHSPCTFVCPVNATTRDEDNGIVTHIYPRCIGCRYCMVACPYHARTFNWWDPTWPKPMESMLSPDVSTRMRGVVEKCTFCHHRLLKAKAKAFADGADPKTTVFNTACADACPTHAITFGNLLDENSAVAKLSKDPRAFRILEKLHTEPKVYYLSKQEWIRSLADNSIKK